MRGAEVQQFESELKALFDTIDDELERTYAGAFPLHPARPPRGSSSNPEADGLFNVGASFSAGYGSDTGRGYVVEIRLSTLSHVDAATRAEIEAYTATRLRELLAARMGERRLEVVRDGSLLKIVGDLSLR